MTNRVLVCTGNLAKNPYYFEKVYVNLYSLEELCYVIYENAFLIDKEIMDRKLVEWINVELGLTSLARDLYQLINQNAMPGAFVGTILQYAGYYNKDEIEKVESILKLNASMNIFEKWKAKADFLYENRHFLLALREYEHLLENISEDEVDLTSKAYNNMGVTYMALYLFDSAIECFKKAYEINNDEAAYRHFLTATRLKVSEDEYIRIIADEESAYRMSVPLEGEYEAAKREFDESDIAKAMRETFAKRDSGEALEYYHEIAKMTEELKADYREIALEAEKGITRE